MIKHLKTLLRLLNRSALVSLPLDRKVCINLHRTGGGCLLADPSASSQTPLPPAHLFTPSPATDSLPQCIEAASYQSLKYTYPRATGKLQSKLCKLRATSLTSQAENCRTLEGIFSQLTHTAD